MNRILLSAAVLVAATPALAATNSTGDGPVLAVWAIIITCYFFPSIIAAFRRHHNTLAIFLLNLFLGWTGLGWLGSLIWAATATGRRRDDF